MFLYQLPHSSYCYPCTCECPSWESVNNNPLWIKPLTTHSAFNQHVTHCNHSITTQSASETSRVWSVSELTDKCIQWLIYQWRGHLPVLTATTTSLNRRSCLCIRTTLSTVSQLTLLLTICKQLASCFLPNGVIYAVVVAQGGYAGFYIQTVKACQMCIQDIRSKTFFIYIPFAIYDSGTTIKNITFIRCELN